MSTNSAPWNQDIGCLNLRWSQALLDGLIQGGLRRLVLSPGSRSTPVVLAAQRRSELLLTPILDERSAAFFALGLARASAEPVALLATSGSAPAHWYPAVIEAAHWGLPLLLLSADRPPLLRHTGANQTIDQTRLFGPFVHEFHDPGRPSADASSLKALRNLGLRAALRSQEPTKGPIQINLPFDEPLVPAGDCPPWEPLSTSTQFPARTVTADTAWPSSWPSAGAGDQTSLKLPSGKGLIVCGPASAASAEEANAIVSGAVRLGLPLLADPLSGLRFAHPSDGGTQFFVSRHYDALLRNTDTAALLKPDWVLRLGLACVSKTLGQWLTDVPTWLVTNGERWCDPSHDACGLIQATPKTLASTLANLFGTSAPPADWWERWRNAEQATRALADRHLQDGPWCEAQLIQQLLQAIPPGEGLLCANSLPIRQLDTWSYPRQQPVWVFGNRGVSGIDGQLSTLAGLNAAGTPTWGLLGDLSFCHDLSGLLLIGELKRPVIVINNGGGRIFDYLPQHGLPEFERYWRTPVTPDLAELARPFGLRHQRVRDSQGFAAALNSTAEACLIEVLIDAEQSRQFHLAFWQAVARTALSS
ncbi:2-succinyl-5-enolpyruvyl-6-hydroxy-3-cyclohexene-1-carboxylic-acid synthase [Thiorhodovibrio frisius]|uniref:2-succinyl-5-enolpyruvyl-6-hydroxy-3-cyclohexene-1-carboxylate synthase n=1 Tax=Thiorhodovibrio frisius TaxID=631362 RepID=H8YWV1_9GAMM|nr:2-succinyl-5-enolpyruvyl-6-hydroxy-3-cyclohexene-1-carboxylic-acid synthase [Thiorhodovibrio frisius]EIC22927.1 2-succinyl-5-enolpyruvyl-6-hydroxy-3-cyclohexene-1-carboxylic-acid synthase [Thiorhodovibrio frisius]WPL22814.1 2-succinyl-5-enolpyruvyl-6-hydroxy-3-cyclohexene-1-carboxylate synthase [Thiorhodovibrio frisius]